MRTVSINGETLDKDKIRPLILDACIEVLTRYGQDALTMSKIAEQAGIAKGTLYNYFENKENLLLGACDAFAQPMFEEFDSIVESSLPARESLIKISQMMVEAYRQYWRVIDAFLSQFGQNSLVEKYEEDSFKARIIELYIKIFKAAEAEGSKLPYSYEIMAELLAAASDGILKCTIKEAGDSSNAFPTVNDLEKFVDMFLPAAGDK